MDPLPVFPTPFTDFSRIRPAQDVTRARYLLTPTPRTVLQKKLDNFSGAVREKLCWWQKVNDEAIVSRWRGEAKDQHISAPMFEFALQVHTTAERVPYSANAAVYRDDPGRTVNAVFQSHELLLRFGSREQVGNMTR